jgi:hypothetical protein
MMQLRDSTVLRIRGSWAPGADYRSGDIVARGRLSFMARQQHIAGADSEPQIGIRWNELWEVWDGAAVLSGPPVAPPQLHVQMQQPAAQVIRLPALAPPHVEYDPPVPVDQPSTALDLATQLEIDSIRQQLKGLARADWVSSQLSRLEALLRGIAERVRAGREAVFDTPVRAEMWRRISTVLSAKDRAEAEQILNQIMRERIRLLAKRDKGLSWTPEEASRASVLELLDNQVARLEERAGLLEAHAIEDPEHERHWPTFKGVS